MNYVQHHRAAHELLLNQAESRPHHFSLYLALFRQWNAERFPVSLALDHAATMAAARIGNERTYRATLYELEEFGLLTYQPSGSKHQPSRCFLAVLPGAEVPPVKTSTGGRSAPGETSTGGRSAPGTPISNKTSCSINVCGAAPKKKMGGRVFEGEGLSEVEVLPADAEHGGAADAPPEKVARKRRPQGGPVGSQAAAIRAATTATAPPDEPRRRPAPLPELPFSQSAIASPEAFAEAFAGTDYALADLRHYHQLVATWRDKKSGLEPTRKDWVATAKRFMLNDAADNRLKLAPGHSPVAAPGADASAQNPGIPTTGWRSSRWD